MLDVPFPMPKASQDDHICRQHKHDIKIQQGLRDLHLRTTYVQNNEGYLYKVCSLAYT